MTLTRPRNKLDTLLRSAGASGPLAMARSALLRLMAAAISGMRAEPAIEERVTVRRTSTPRSPGPATQAPSRYHALCGRRVLVVEPDDRARARLLRGLDQAGAIAEAVPDFQSAREQLRRPIRPEHRYEMLWPPRDLPVPPQIRRLLPLVELP